MKVIYTVILGSVLSGLLIGCSTDVLSTGSKDGYFKIGKPYEIDGDWYYPEENFDYEEEGMASWYGPNFHGKPTANGGVFNQYAVTAAHRTLPLPSIVKVTNLENGRSLVVKVNDRGPYAKGRIIDLSKRTATLLGSLDKGVTKVRVTYLPDETEKLYAQLGITPSHRQKMRVRVAEYRRVRDKLNATTIQSVAVKPEVVIETPVVLSDHVFIQAGAFGVKTNAEKLAEKLLEFGASSISSIDVQEKTLYRVRMGPFDSKLMADEVLTKLSHIGLDASLVMD